MTAPHLGFVTEVDSTEVTVIWTITMIMFYSVLPGTYAVSRYNIIICAQSDGNNVPGDR